MPKRISKTVEIQSMWPAMNEVRGNVLQLLEGECHAVGQGLWFARNSHPINRRLYNDIAFWTQFLRQLLHFELHEEYGDS